MIPKELPEMQVVPLKQAIHPKRMSQNQGMMWKLTSIDTLHNLLCRMKLQFKWTLHDVTCGILPSIPSISCVGHVIYLVEVNGKVRLTHQTKF